MLGFLRRLFSRRPAQAPAAGYGNELSGGTAHNAVQAGQIHGGLNVDETHHHTHHHDSTPGPTIGTVTGNVGTVAGTVNGPVHTGTGDQYNVQGVANYGGNNTFTGGLAIGPGARVVNNGNDHQS